MILTQTGFADAELSPDVFVVSTETTPESIFLAKLKDS
jgi:hypothetical protein